MPNESLSVFPFHYGGEAESYTFYRVPKVLFTDERFDRISTDAKLLYGLLLDRMQLSLKHDWVDEDGKVFIYYTVESIMEALTCGNKKAGALLAELDDKRGIGLITRVRQGMGRPDKIYVHKCVLPDMSNRQVKTCQSDISRHVETTLHDMSKGHANNTEKNKNKISETDLIASAEPEQRWDESAMDERKAYREYFWESCSFAILKSEYPYADELDEILELLVDVCSSTQKTIRISGDEKPIQIVKSRFMKLDCEHIRYVLDCFHKNTTEVRNIKQYLLASLYNAPMTINSYYSALVQHDMYGAD